MPFLASLPRSSPSPGGSRRRSRPPRRCGKGAGGCSAGTEDSGVAAEERFSQPRSPRPGPGSPGAVSTPEQCRWAGGKEGVSRWRSAGCLGGMLCRRTALSPCQARLFISNQKQSFEFVFPPLQKWVKEDAFYMFSLCFLIFFVPSPP